MFIVNKDKTKIYNLDHIAKIRQHGRRIEAVTGNVVEELGLYTSQVEANWALEHIMSRIVSQKTLIEMPRHTETKSIGNSEDRMNE